MLVTLSYFDTFHDERDTVEVDTLKIIQHAEMDGDDLIRSRRLCILAGTHCPRGKVVEEVGDFDESSGVLDVYVRDE